MGKICGKLLSVGMIENNNWCVMTVRMSKGS